MILVLEGADNSGKSTLAKKLASDFGIEVVHPGGPPKNIADVLTRCNEQRQIFSMSDSVDFVYDRITCISDYVYRGNARYDEVFQRYQKALRYAPDVKIVYCRPSNERLRNFDDHVTQAHETDEVVEHAKRNVGRIISAYDELFRRLENDQKLVIHRYNFEMESYDEFKNRCFRMETA